MKFKDPTAPKQKKHGAMPWSFKAPSKDQAVSGSLSAGDDYGVGHRNPVGKEKASMSSSPIPMNTRCFNPKDVIDGETRG